MEKRFTEVKKEFLDDLRSFFWCVQPLMVVIGSERPHFRKKFIKTTSSPKERKNETVFVALGNIGIREDNTDFFGDALRAITLEWWHN